MAQGSWPADAHNSRNVTEAELEKLSARFSDDGLYGSPADAAPVVAGTGLQVLVRADLYGSLRGFAWTSGTVDDALTIPANSSGSTRVDRVVLQLDRSTWNVRAVVIPGTPGAGPPPLTRTEFDTGVFEELMADVTIGDGASTVTVTPRPVYVGTRVRAAASGKHRLSPGLGEINYEPDTGKWTGFSGTVDKVLYEDTGWAVLTLNGQDKSKWQIQQPFKYRRLNGVVWLGFRALRVGSTLKTTDADGSTIAVLPSGFRPSANAPQILGTGNHSRNYLQLFVEPDGVVKVYPMIEDLPVNRSVYAYAQFPIG